jgi:hypothetical protein
MGRTWSGRLLLLLVLLLVLLMLLRNTLLLLLLVLLLLLLLVLMLLHQHGAGHLLLLGCHAKELLLGKGYSGCSASLHWVHPAAYSHASHLVHTHSASASTTHQVERVNGTGHGVLLRLLLLDPVDGLLLGDLAITISGEDGGVGTLVEVGELLLSVVHKSGTGLSTGASTGKEIKRLRFVLWNG